MDGPAAEVAETGGEDSVYLAEIENLHDRCGIYTKEATARGMLAGIDWDVGADLSNKGLGDYAGKKRVLNIFPSVDTPVCATSIRKFNEQAGSKDGVVVLCISADLPVSIVALLGPQTG